MTSEPLKSLSEIHKTLAFFQRENAKTELYDASRFSPFQFIRTNENGLSEIIAFLLDPSQNHGQQDLFLNSLLKYLNLPEYLSYNNVSVTCENATFNNRRHDIFIEDFLHNKRQWIISIENKLRYAVDQNNQLEDYWKDINRYSPNFCCLIYLSPFKKPPSEQSIDTDRWNKLIQDNQAKAIGAEDLIKWLEQTPIVAPNIRAFCQSFIQFLKEDIMNETKENNQLLDELVKNPNWVETATTLLELSDNIYQKLEDSLVQQLQKILNDNKKYSRMIKYNWHFYNIHKEGIFLDKEDKKYSWSIGIANDNKKYHNVYYGFWANKDNISQENYQRLEEIFKLEGFEQAKWWIQWQYCNGNLRNWDGKTWKDVITGHLAKQIFELLEPFIKQANENLEELKCITNK
ncbi:PD-(D/E)XK nuclease family protein [Avibacterium sp. 21-599]|uniref:PD-(D/E)XK nuclease family protein n=1 Tax=Avibacterium sp. 21-599 TaxID=2911528 RepID=UPI00224776A1|nr:PD-(D/E)XK nuclease family protein [Avibacterium sp. 21-599]MCW9718150.1 PD-(D/E)XK nuclease family protein [Avibacterium sp. 21-599]